MAQLNSDATTHIHTFSFISRDKVTRIRGILWIPTEPVRAIVQISHGMTEHISRYDRFARYLNSKGVLVAGHDHLGHGSSVTVPEHHGFFAENRGDEILVRDLHRVTEYLKKNYLGLPLFLLGHSMGSFLVRRYLTVYGNDIDGALILGTGNQPNFVLNFGIALSTAESTLISPHFRSKFCNYLIFNSYNKRISAPRTTKDWLTKDSKIVDTYLADPFCQFEFTSNGYMNLFKTIKYTKDMENLKKMPKDLPVLIACGEEDPVGNYGKAAKEVYTMFYEAGMKDVSLRLYKDDRHELLNETDSHQIFQDLWQWIYSRII